MFESVFIHHIVILKKRETKREREKTQIPKIIFLFRGPGHLAREKAVSSERPKIFFTT